MNLQEAGDAPRIRHIGSSQPTGEKISQRFDHHASFSNIPLVFTKNNGVVIEKQVICN